MKYIIHIGQSKTGTSSLQSFLAINRKALCEKGFLFPDVFINNMPLNVLEHNALADQLAGFTRYPNLSAEAYFDQFQEQAIKHKCHTIILSAESFMGTPQIWRVPDKKHFWEAQTTKINALSNFVKGNETNIVAYMRPQSSWFESALSQIIRTEGLLGHRIYENDEQLFDFLKPHMDYRRLLSLWSTEFQSEKLSVIPFDRKLLNNQNIIDDFCTRISLDMKGLELPEQQENVGLDRRYIWLKKQLNQQKKSKAKERLIINLLSKLSDALPDIKKYQISSNLRAKIDDFYIPENQKLCKEYGISTPNTLTTPAPSKENSTITEEEKESALASYKRETYSLNALSLFIRYSSGAFLRQYLPSVNALLKQILQTK